MSRIFDAYVAGGAREVFAGDPAQAEDRARAVSAAARPRTPLTEAVGEALRRQNARFGPSAARERHLAELAAGAVAVVTGQQVGLFLGPLFTVYKAATAIVAARALRAETGASVVPVFWLQTEDHDLPEIASCVLPSERYEARALSVPIAADSRVSVAHVKLPDAIDACHATLAAELSALPHAAAHLARLARHYRAGAGFAEAFAGLLAELFEPEGLLVLDPREPALAALLLPLHQKALRDADVLAGALLARDAFLRERGFEPGVHVRPDSPLGFFHPRGHDGPRYRLQQTPGGLAEVGGVGGVGGERVHAPDQVLAAIEAEPRCASSSALLRPLLQDTLLPTVMYVGGPGELAYFAQLQPLYQHFGMRLPLFLPRARFTLVEPRTARLLGPLGLSVQDAGAEPAALLARLRERDPAPLPSALPSALPSSAAVEQRLSSGFERVLDETLRELTGLEGPLRMPKERTQHALRRAASKLAASVDRALAQRDAARMQGARQLLAFLHPRGMPQERIFGLPYFAARHGERPFLERVLSAIDPFVFQPKVLCL